MKRGAYCHDMGFNHVTYQVNVCQEWVIQSRNIIFGNGAILRSSGSVKGRVDLGIVVLAFAKVYQIILDRCSCTVFCLGATPVILCESRVDGVKASVKQRRRIHHKVVPAAVPGDAMNERASVNDGQFTDGQYAGHA